MKKDEPTEKTLTRRNFLKITGGSAAVAAAVAGGVTLLPSPADAACDALPKKWDETYDVIVIGSGFAGLAAAIEAKNGGAKDVVVLEKMPVHGGNSVINGGDFCA
ncbi:MAG TPA: FAD-binding protein, partial [Smithellaceae bacterium]|nr:FAD-binding protein [Smithellaceae bacterium]HQN66698.1 FAD-binding protein [Smithellaceae bacterium]HQP06849.1 FAD-binding protein [Smithellaceae bacterium]